MYLAEHPAAEGTECQSNGHIGSGSDKVVLYPYFSSHSVQPVFPVLHV